MLDSTSFVKQPRKTGNPCSPRAGEAQPILFDEDGNETDFLRSLPDPVKKHVLAHGSNGFPPILPDDGGKMPTGVVVCVRDRKGLIGYAKDGAGARLKQATLAEVAGPKPKKAKKVRGSKDGAGSPEKGSEPKPPSAPLPPVPEQDAPPSQP